MFFRTRAQQLPNYKKSRAGAKVLRKLGQNFQIMTTTATLI